MKIGRPTIYSQELAETICIKLANGMSLRKICTEAGMPANQTVRNWLNTNQDFVLQYARAREDQAEYYADEMVEIADSADKDTANAARVRVDTRKWIASKLRPKKYGELVKHEHGGADGAPIPVSVTVTYVKPGNTS